MAEDFDDSDTSALGEGGTPAAPPPVPTAVIQDTPAPAPAAVETLALATQDGRCSRGGGAILRKPVREVMII